MSRTVSRLADMLYTAERLQQLTETRSVRTVVVVDVYVYVKITTDNHWAIVDRKSLGVARWLSGRASGLRQVVAGSRPGRDVAA